ncbi:hypothetical protein ABIB37_000587 [Agrococcus sp. UYP10]|uniref:Antitoxin protein of toxin-antitoxin system n=1 Tax=Agrococcus jenensis TaxID=46353 RepID=A0A3N2ASW9_9MICO|nr:Rv0909 family putative TA system antitoxin [Agrococcus jenensis]ROR66015.1 antitoxin protein of toxin-antitoxin system [Agrococcus jenensis]
MGIGDLVNKAKEALSSEQGEQTSDRIIQGAGDGFDRLSGGRFADRTDSVQEHADRFLGQGGADAALPQDDADAATVQPQDDAPRH